MTAFASRLKQAMDQAGVNQSELAVRTGASKAAVSQYLSGKNIPGIDRIQALAEALGVTFDYLIASGTEPAPAFPTRKISVRDAARCMGKSDQFIRVGLQRGLLPFGSAVPGVGNAWSYYISPAKFKDFVGEEQFNRFFCASNGR